MDKHHTFVNTMIALDLATRGGMLRMLVVQKLSKSGQFAKSISFLNPDPKVTQNQKKCPICWVSHMFSIWKHRYSYGICFGPVYALQNSTPNILSFLFSVHTRRVEKVHIQCSRS